MCYLCKFFWIVIELMWERLIVKAIATHVNVHPICFVCISLFSDKVILIQFKMSSHDEEEDTGPSVDSTDPEERIAARRLRIAKRIEAARR